MLRKLWVSAALAASLVFFAGSASALSTDTFERIPYGGVIGIFELPDSAKDEKDSAAYRAIIGYPFGVHSSLELSYFDSRLVRKSDNRPNFDSGLVVDYAYDFGLFGFGRKYLPNFKPYLIAGAGIERDDENDHHGFYHPTIDAGAGLLFPISFRNWNWGWALRAEARAVAEYVEDTGTPNYVDKHVPVDYHFGVGLEIPFSFHSHNAAAPMKALSDCATTVVDPVTGRSDCIGDSDGDGVTDDKDQCPGTPAGTRVDEKGCPIEPGNDEDGDGVLDSDDQCPHTQPGVKVDAKGCAIEQTVVLEGVNFETNSAILTGQATKILGNVAQSMLGQKNLSVEVGGYTDNTGGKSYNLTLSKQRAESVRQYLIGKGVEGSRMTTKGYGESNPIESNDTAKGRAVNRRVEFKIILQH